MAQESTNKVRLPTQVNISTRDGSVNRGRFIHNGFLEETLSGQKITIKRPGIIVEAQGAGVANGSFFYNGNVYQYSNNNPTNPAITPISFLNGSYYWGGVYSGSALYQQNEKVNAIDPYTVQVKQFYARGKNQDNSGNRSTIPDPTTEPNTPGSLYWGTVSGVSLTDIYASSTLANNAANAYVATLVGQPTPQSGGTIPAWAGYFTNATNYGAFGSAGTITIGSGAGTTFSYPANSVVVGVYIALRTTYPTQLDKVLTIVIFKY